MRNLLGLTQFLCGMQINYPAIGVFMNATIVPLPWWPKREGLIFKWALTARAGMEDRTHPRWWYPDVLENVLVPVDSMGAVSEKLRSITKEQVNCQTITYEYVVSSDRRMIM